MSGAHTALIGRDAETRRHGYGDGKQSTEEITTSEAISPAPGSWLRLEMQGTRLGVFIQCTDVCVAVSMRSKGGCESCPGGPAALQFWTRLVLFEADEAEWTRTPSCSADPQPQFFILAARNCNCICIASR